MKHGAIATTMTIAAALVAMVVTAIFPAYYWWINYHAQQDEITAAARIHASQITRALDSDPQSWHFQRNRLSSLINQGHSPSKFPEVRAVLDLKGNVLARSPGRIDEPSITHAEPVYDSGNPVGIVTVQRSTRLLLQKVTLVAMLGLGLGLMLFVILRILPLRALNHANISLHREKEQLRIMLDHALDPIISMDHDGIIESFNVAAEKNFGYLARQIIGNNIRKLMPGFEPNSIDEPKTGKTMEGVARRRNRSLFPVEYTLSSTAESSSSQLVLILRDITERKLAQQSMAFNANYDSLTQLPNRALFRERLAHAIARARRHEKLAALMFLDLDRFKIINDSLGHAIGDLLLQAVAKRLTETLRATDTVTRHSAPEYPYANPENATVSRLGGDEFTVIIEGLNHVNDAATAAQKIIQAMAQHFELGGHIVYVTVSIGIALFPLDESDIDTLIKHADVAMYRSKQSGRNDYHFYGEEMNNRVHERLVMENSLRSALANEEFHLHYQPKMNIATGQVVGVEALLRWRNEKFPEIGPNKFIPMLEEMGLIGEVGEWVLRTACTQMQAWKKQGLPPLTLAVNLSALQFRQNDITDRIGRILQHTALDPSLLELEMTESLLMDHGESTRNTLSTLSGLGIKISLDDFGTGYSSLAYLKRFPINALKIDRSFVKDIASNANDAAITQAIIALAHSLQMDVIAEGVETGEQQAFLQKLGCTQMQGYLISRPIPPHYFVKWIRNQALLIDY